MLKTTQLTDRSRNYYLNDGKVATVDSWRFLFLRGDRDHKGLDIVCSDGSTVYAPFDVTLHGGLTVYADSSKAAINSGINLRGEGQTLPPDPVSPVGPAIMLLMGLFFVSCRSVFQAVLRETRPDLWVPEERGQDRHHDVHAECLPRNHITHPRPDV